MLFKVRRIVQIIIIVLVFIVAVFMWKYMLFTASEDLSCFIDNPKNPINELPMMETIISSKRQPVFFMETSCLSRAKGKVVLHARQACAIESAARMNSKSDIYVLFPSPTTLNFSENSRSDKIIAQILKYKNVKFRHINFEEYFQNSPLEEWFKSGTLQRSSYVRSHTSDVLRYLTLWKYGGTYLDLDVVVITRLEKLKPNYAGAESWNDVAAGVLNFDRSVTGRTLAEQCVLDIRDNFNGRDWGSNGPGVITRLLTKVCETRQIKEMTPDRCGGFTVYPPDAFYAIQWKQWNLFFDEEKYDVTLNKIKNSKVVHVWNRFSISKNVTVGSKQPYGIIAQRYCPRVYKESGYYF